MAIYQLGDVAPQIDPTAYVFETAVLIGDVRMAPNSSVWPNAVLRADNDPIFLGEGSNVQDGSVLHTDIGHPLVIGKNVTIGHQVMLHGCTIGDRSLIGMQAIILNGARIGRNCLIGAGALVPEGKEIPDNSMVLGSPGKIVRTFTEEDVAKYLGNGGRHYQERGRQYRDSLKRIG